MKVSIILPTYNERSNLRAIVEKILEVFKTNKINGEIVVVDDNSPDKTGLLAKELAKKYKVIRVLERKKKLGLASAVLDGFKIAHGNILGVMDADFSHPPEAIPRLLQQIKVDNADFVIGSRYIDGGKIEGWSLRRKLLSKGATFLAKFLAKVKDPMSGFFFIKRNVIEKVNFNPKGYKIALEIIVKGRYRKLVEIPYTFTNRKAGKSKLNLREIISFLCHYFDLLNYKNPTIFQFIKFAVAGGLGVIINLFVLYILVEFLGIWYVLSAIFAFIVAVTNNFILNKFWTFKSYSRNKTTIATQYTKFFATSLTALAINLSLLLFLVEYFHLWYILAQLLAILIATSINFLGSKIWVFSEKNETKEK